MVLAMQRDDDHDVLEEAREFLRVKTSHVDRLKAELAQAESRVAEIKALLTQFAHSALPAGAAPGHRPPEASIPKNASLPAAITAVLANGAKMRIGEIVKAVTRARQKSTPAVVYPAIYRMADDGRLLVEGEKKDALYFLPPTKNM